MGMRMPETCWAVFKRQVINLRSCCIWLVDTFRMSPVFVPVLLFSFSPPRPQITSPTKYFHTFSHWKSYIKFGTHAVKCYFELHAVTYVLENRHLCNPIHSSRRSTTSWPHVHTHTRTVLHWLHTGGAQNARKFPINLHTRAPSGQYKTGRHAHKCDSKEQHNSSCDTT